MHVNGKKAGAYNINKRKVEVADLLVEGGTEIKVEVSSSLNNRNMEIEMAPEGGGAGACQRRAARAGVQADEKGCR